MRMITIHLTDEQLLTLAKVTFAPGGVMGNWGNAMDSARVDPRDVSWLLGNEYMEVVQRRAPGGHLPHLRVTDKGKRELMLRFV